MQKRIAILNFSYPVSYSPTILNTALYWARKGFLVDILVDRFVFEDIEKQHPNVFIHYCTDLKPILKVSVSEASKVVGSIQPWYIKMFAPIVVYWSLFRSVILNWRIPLRKYAKGVKKVIEKNTYDLVIAFEPEALTVASQVFKEFGVKYYYHSLEIYDTVDLKNKMRRKMEKLAAKNILFAVVQDEDRSKKLSSELGLSKIKMKLCPVSVMGPVITMKTDAICKKFNIGPEKKVILYLGAFYSEAYIEEMAMSTNNSDWDKDWVLILHGFCNSKKILDDIFSKTDRNRVVVSLDPLKQTELDSFAASADVSVALYKQLNDNYQMTILSSGKIAQYSKCSLPVILIKNKYVEDFIRKNKCGYCIDGIDEFNSAIRTILNDHSAYKKAMSAAFEKYYDFEANYFNIASLLEINK